MTRKIAFLCIMICSVLFLLSCAPKETADYIILSEDAVYYCAVEGYQARLIVSTETKKIAYNSSPRYKNTKILIDVTPMYLELQGKELRYHMGKDAGVFTWQKERNCYHLTLNIPAPPEHFFLFGEDGVSEELFFVQTLSIDSARLIKMAQELFLEQFNALSAQKKVPIIKIKHLEQSGTIYFFCGLYDGEMLKCALITDEEYVFLSQI